MWKKTQITDDTAKLIFYSAFIDGKLEAPRSLLPEVHRLYFEPQYEEFAARTIWSLSNAFTSWHLIDISTRYSTGKQPEANLILRGIREGFETFCIQSSLLDVEVIIAVNAAHHYLNDSGCLANRLVVARLLS